MLFNSYEFLLVFLPVCLSGYYWASRLASQRTAIAWLALCSLFFYGWWNPAYLGLMIASILFNYGAGLLLAGQLFFGQIVEEARLGLSGAGTIAGMVGLGLLTASFVMRRQAQADRNARTGPADNAP